MRAALITILAALAASLAAFSAGISVQPAPSAPAATTTPAAVPDAPSVAPAAPAAPASASSGLSPVMPLTPTEMTLGLILPKVRSATVNIICLPKDNSIRGVSGSGVIIDPRGIILTAAHVGEFVMLEESRPDLLTCTIRTGSPATASYTAAAVYVSPDWIRKNSGVISAAAPSGTGENDFALLAITGSATSASLPSSFPSVPLASSDPAVKDPVVIGSYGAEFLDSAQIRTSLFPTLVYGAIQDIYTFGSNTIDLISVGGGAAAQEGSSGGGIANDRDQVIGLITTSSIGSDLDARKLHAITANYIRRAFSDDENESIDSYLSAASPSELVQEFQDQADTLSSVLVKANKLK